MAIFDFLKRKSIAVVDCDEACYRESVKALRRRDFGAAYRIICQWNVNSGKRGLGFDWRHELERGMDRETESVLREFYAKESSSEMVHSAVFGVLSGNTPCAVATWACGDKEQCREASLDIHYLTSKYLTLKDIKQAEESECDQLVFIATLDNETCPICGKMDGRIVRIKDGMIGKNLPPLHKGCRCTIAPYYDDSDEEDTTRIAKNPETGKNYEVPAKMTWLEWKKN